MKEIMIDCSQITTSKDFHRVLQRRLSFPEWYGCNLDALYDALTSITENTKITFMNFNQMDSWCIPFRCVLDDAEIENPNLFINYA